MPKAAWHRGSNSSAVHDPLGEPGCTPLKVGLPFAWGTMDGDFMFFPISWEGSFLGALADINK